MLFKRTESVRWIKASYRYEMNLIIYRRLHFQEHLVGREKPLGFLHTNPPAGHQVILLSADRATEM